jgi:UDP-N-acetylmuramate--alanine ligase
MLQKGTRTGADSDRAAAPAASDQPSSPPSVAPAGPVARTPRRRSPIAGIPRRVHLLGAGGAGVSGAARLLVDHGHVLSAHDRSETEHIALLREMDIAVEISSQESARLPEGVELVIRSAAVNLSEHVLREAQERGVAVLKYSEALGRITPAGRTLAIAGTHGKTTSSWMVHHALRGLSAIDPTRPMPMPGAIIGGICRTLGTNAVTEEDGGWFAAEACEYDKSFLHLSPRGAIVTNVEADHLDFYGTLDEIKKAFTHFADRVHPQGLLVVGKDVARCVEVAARCPVWRLGRELKYEITGERRGSCSFRLAGPNFVVDELQLGVPGTFNVENASLAIALVVGLAAREWNIDPNLAAAHAARGIAAYRGSQRRFEPWGTYVSGRGTIDVIHDYAHHPTEVSVTLAAARRVFPGLALHVLFQPHQHSRTARFLDDFVESLRAADRVVIADVYGARAHIDGENLAGAPELVAKLQALGRDAAAGGDKSQSVSELVAHLPNDCAVLVLGAGDIVQVKDELDTQLARSRAR